MTVEIDYKAIGKLVPLDLVKKIKEDVEVISSVSEIDKLSIHDSESYIIIGFSTVASIYVYRYRKQDKSFVTKSLSISDYWFIEEMLEGGK